MRQRTRKPHLMTPDGIVSACLPTPLFPEADKALYAMKALKR